MNLLAGLEGFSPLDGSLVSDGSRFPGGVDTGFSALTGSLCFKLEGLTLVSESLVSLSILLSFLSLDFLSPTDFRLTWPNGDCFSSVDDLSGALGPVGI